MSDDQVQAPDLLEVVQLSGRYCAAVDDGDPEGAAALFTGTGVMAVEGREVSGSAALARFFLRAPRGVHVTGLPWVRPDGVVISPFVFVGRSGDTLAGQYRDTLSRTDLGLRFLRREVELSVTISNEREPS